MNYNELIRCDIKRYKKIVQNLHKMNIKLILLNLQCNLMLKSFNETEHPRDEKGRFSNKGENSITETLAEQALSNKELKNAVFDYAREHFQGNTYINKNTGDVILVSRDGLSEWKTKSKSREQILSIKILDKLLTNAKKISSAEELKNRRSILGYDYYSCECRISGKNFNAIITIKKPINSEKKYYHHYLEDIKIEPSSRILHPAQNKRDALLLDGFSKSIPCFNKTVNSLNNVKNLKKARTNNISKSILWLKNYLIQSGKREEKNYIDELSKYLERRREVT
ncbi:hypothetical protein [Treponema putidum]|uniref:LPD3 domain-containing protein n=1 Tax=Treponema putidum TaxID=221027 RepID=UPI003D900C2E